MFKPGDRVRVVSVPRDDSYFARWLNAEFTVVDDTLNREGKTCLKGKRPDEVASSGPFYWSTDSLELVDPDGLDNLRRIVEDYRGRGYEVKIFVTPPPITPKETAL